MGWKMEIDFDRELQPNEFYLLVQNPGYFMKTKNKEDFQKVLGWEQNKDIIFREIVKSSDYLHYKVSSIIHKIKIACLLISKNQSETIWYDVNELKMPNGNKISFAKLGGKQKPEVYEKL